MGESWETYRLNLHIYAPNAIVIGRNCSHCTQNVVPGSQTHNVLNE